MTTPGYLSIHLSRSAPSFLVLNRRKSAFRKFFPPFSQAPTEVMNELNPMLGIAAEAMVESSQFRFEWENQEIS